MKPHLGQFSFGACLISLIFAVISLASIDLARASYGIEHGEDGVLIELSDLTIEAIDNGVSLTFVCDFAVRKKWLLLNWPSKQRKHKFIISRHALSDRYLVHQDDKPTPAIFRSSSQSVAFISKSAQNLFRGYSHANPEMQLKISLSKYDLPAPMRLTAFTSSQWDFDSGWGQWQPVD